MLWSKWKVVKRKEKGYYNAYRRAAGIVLAGINTSPKGGQHQEPFYSRHNNLSICQKVQLAFDNLATIEGLVVLSSLSRGVNAWEDSASSPSIDAIM